MKTKKFISVKGLQIRFSFLFWLLFICWLPAKSAENGVLNSDSLDYLSCKGLVIDGSTTLPLPFASILVEGTNIASVTNSEGEFMLKVPSRYIKNILLITYIGFRNERIPISSFSKEIKQITLNVAEIGLSEVRVVSKDAEDLMRTVFDMKKENYVTEPTLMTAFYRETIKFRKTYISLLEAVVDIYKFPVTSKRDDLASIYKIRKKADYTKLDTLVLKLAGGPYNTLCLDIMKNLDYTFTHQVFNNYDFKSLPTTMQDNHPVYVIDFKQKPYVTEPLYQGQLYVDAVNFAMFSASFDLNLEDAERATALFLLRKPDEANVELTKAHYHVNYVLREGKWYMSYGRAEMNFKVDWKWKLFNSNYETVVEMAVTDWEPDAGGKWARTHQRLKPETVVADESEGFGDPEFWGSENIIEPEKSIDAAINKIQKKLKDRY